MHTKSFPVVDTKIKCPQCRTVADEATHRDVLMHFAAWTQLGLEVLPYMLSCDDCGALYFVDDVRIEKYYTTRKSFETTQKIRRITLT